MKDFFRVFAKSAIFFYKPHKGRMVFVLISLIFSMGYGQSDWVNYLAQKDKGLMSLHVDLGLNYVRPNYKNLLIVGSRFNGCLKNGFPDQSGLEKVYVFSDSLAKVVNKTTKSKLVGIITYQCYAFDIFYVKDTIDLRKKINRMIDQSFSRAKSHMTIKEDRKWDYYYKNIFPTNAPNDFFIDHEFLNELAYQGDDLTEERLVTHWMKFKKQKKMIKFVDEVKVLKFKVDSLYGGREASFPYELQISRKDHIDPKTIYNLSNTLKVMALKNGGLYDGWGADAVIKE